MAKKESKRWMDWYNYKGGREKVLAKRKAHGWMNKKEYEEMTAR